MAHIPEPVEGSPFAFPNAASGVELTAACGQCRGDEPGRWEGQVWLPWSCRYKIFTPSSTSLPAGGRASGLAEKCVADWAAAGTRPSRDPYQLSDSTTSVFAYSMYCTRQLRRSAARRARAMTPPRRRRCRCAARAAVATPPSCSTRTSMQSRSSRGPAGRLPASAYNFIFAIQ